MVAYNFARVFVDPIRAGEKSQTIRPPRKRHARVGEPVQLYVDQRSSRCEKIVDPDPVCLSVSPIHLCVDDRIISTIAIGGAIVRDMRSFAMADGFETLAEMHRFFSGQYGVGRFEGVLIRWAPVDGEDAT